MSSRRTAGDLDLARGLSTEPADLAALRRARALERPMSPEEYVRFLAQFTIDPERLRSRPGPRGEPFTLR